MKTTARRGYVVLLLVMAVLAGTVYLGIRLFANAESWATMRANAHLTSQGSFVGAGRVTDRTGEVLAQSKDGKRVYNNSERIRRATLHIVGDSEGYISSGVQTAYRPQLSGYSMLTGIWSLEKYGRGNDISLTLDASVCAKALDALGSRQGVVAVYNYKTGELLCAVSAPNFDIRNKPSASQIEENEGGEYDGVYMNRLIDGLYTPGSTFKILTTACAVENRTDLSGWRYRCTGETYINGVKITCPSVHGSLNFEEAFADSCNCAYAELATELGAGALTKTATELGFGRSFAFGNGMTEKSIIDLSGASKSDLAWAGVGQYTTLVNPYQMLAMAGALANGGKAVLPYAVSSIQSPSGRVLSKTKPVTEEWISENVANLVRDMMRNNVVTHYGDGNFSGLEMCGKTGTAEVGGDEEPHAWFVGFSEKADCPLAIVVVVENGGWGASVAIPVASATMQAAYRAIS